MSISKEGWGKIAASVLLAVATVISVLLGVSIELQSVAPTVSGVGSQALTERISLNSYGDNVINNGYDLTLYSGDHSSAKITLAGDSGNATFAGVVTLSSNMIHSSVSITPTDGGTLTPTAKLVTLTPAAAVGVSLGACTTGSETVLYNSVNANVVITDTGNGVLAGDQTLGQYDALRLSCYGSKWVQESAASAN